MGYHESECIICTDGCESPLSNFACFDCLNLRSSAILDRIFRIDERCKYNYNICPICQLFKLNVYKVSLCNDHKNASLLPVPKYDNYYFCRSSEVKNNTYFYTETPQLYASGWFTNNEGLNKYMSYHEHVNVTVVPYDALAKASSATGIVNVLELELELETQSQLQLEVPCDPSEYISVVARHPRANNVLHYWDTMELLPEGFSPNGVHYVNCLAPTYC